MLLMLLCTHFRDSTEAHLGKVAVMQGFSTINLYGPLTSTQAFDLWLMDLVLRWWGLIPLAVAVVLAVRIMRAQPAAVQPADEVEEGSITHLKLIWPPNVDEAPAEHSVDLPTPWCYRKANDRFLRPLGRDDVL